MTIMIFIDDDDDGEPEWRWWFAKSCLQVHLSVISSVFSTANVNISVRKLKPKLILKITYIQLIFPLKMFKSNLQMALLLPLKPGILCQHWISPESRLKKPQELLQPKICITKDFWSSSHIFAS